MKVLIVDDHAGVRRLIRQIVTVAGVSVRECTSGDEAVSAAREFRPDCATMDLRMPGMNAFTAIRALREEHPAIRIAVVTAFDSSDFRRAATEVGAIGFVLKDNLAELATVLAIGAASARQNDLPPAATPGSLDPKER